jgi:hypothetical protein
LRGLPIIANTRILISCNSTLNNSPAVQRLAAQPFGRARYVATILAGKYKCNLSVFSLSLGQVG